MSSGNKRGCVHLNFAVQANVNRLFDKDEVNTEVLLADSYSMDLYVECADCGKKFMFFGAPVGLDPRHPCMSVDQLELRVPICPEGESPTILSPGFTIKGVRSKFPKGVN